MSVTQQPFAFTGAFQLAADQSLPQQPVPFNYSGSYTALEASLLNVGAPGSIDVPFGSVTDPGAKGILVRYDAQTGAQPVLLTFNGASVPIELTAGGFLVYFNPTPSDGITSLSIQFAASCQLRVWILG